MNILPGSVTGDTVQMAEHSFSLDKTYGPLSGRTEIGIRPEFIRITRSDDAQAVPLSVTAVENVGRHKIVRGTVNGQKIDAVIDEYAEVPTDAYVVFDTTRMNVYEDSHLVRGQV